MLFTEMAIKGVYLIGLERKEDHRGFFARAWCHQEFDTHGLNPSLVQVNVGFSRKKGTLRGMHFQRHPHQEAQLVRCTMGQIFDVAVDLRPNSPTYRQWVGAELTADNRAMLYVPEGCAHGYQTLQDDAEVVYQTSTFFSATHATGVRFDDPAFGIVWPMGVEVISEMDKVWPLMVP